MIDVTNRWNIQRFAENEGTTTLETPTADDTDTTSETDVSTDNILDREIEHQPGAKIKVGQLVESHKRAGNEISRLGQQLGMTNKETEELRKKIVMYEGANATFEQIFKNSHYGPKMSALIKEFLENPEGEEPEETFDDPVLAKLSKSTREANKRARNAERVANELRENEEVRVLGNQVHEERVFIEKEELEPDGLLANIPPADRPKWFFDLNKEAKDQGITMKNWYLLKYQDHRFDRRSKLVTSKETENNKAATAGLSGANGNGVARPGTKVKTPKTAEQRRAHADKVWSA